MYMKNVVGIEFTTTSCKTSFLNISKKTFSLIIKILCLIQNLAFAKTWHRRLRKHYLSPSRFGSKHLTDFTPS